MCKTKNAMQMTRQGKRPRSLVRALATRELHGCSTHLGELVTRQRWTMDQVLSVEDCAVLLGFSSDGNYLVYYSIWESSHIVHWKRIRSPIASDRLELQLALRFEVGNPTQVARPFGTPNLGSRLRVWQSVDDQVVVVIAIDTHGAMSQDAGPTYHLTISPSPHFCSVQSATQCASLSFSFALPCPSPEIEPWQLVATSKTSHVLILNMGSSIALLVLSMKRVQLNTESGIILPPTTRRTNFETREWYAPCEHPLEFRHEEFGQDAANRNPNPNRLEIQCNCQQEFDCEAFLASFFRKYAAFRDLHLVDYDVQLVRAHAQESSLYMTCTADLESSLSISSRSIEQSRLALFFSLKIFTGEYHVMRALKVPRHQPLRRLSSVLANKFRGDLTERIPFDAVPTECNNDPVVRGHSLAAVHNPRFPVSIYLK